MFIRETLIETLLEERATQSACMSDLFGVHVQVPIFGRYSIFSNDDFCHPPPPNVGQLRHSGCHCAGHGFLHRKKATLRSQIVLPVRVSLLLWLYHLEHRQPILRPNHPAEKQSAVLLTAIHTAACDLACAGRLWLVHSHFLLCPGKYHRPRLRPNLEVLIRNAV